MKEYRLFAIQKLRDNLSILEPQAEQIARIWTRHKKLPYYYYYLKDYFKRVPPLSSLLNFKVVPAWPPEFANSFDTSKKFANEKFVTLSEGLFPELIELPWPTYIPNVYRHLDLKKYKYAKPLNKKFAPVYFFKSDLDFLEKILKVKLSSIGLKLLNEALLYHLPLDNLHLPKRVRRNYAKNYS